MTDLARLSASEASREIAAGRLKSVDLVNALLEHIAAREPQVQAWQYIVAEQALAQARARDAEPARSRLHGIPVGIKDVIDTADMPTEYGSPIHRGHQPNCDAACVAQVREAGGVVLGKTVSTEFATRHPGKTRNPHAPGHTPGGSSSGSAAAVADCMVPIAFGTQTSSSIIRPAAFCGTVGYKPTFGLINRAGMKFLSESIDTIGPITRTVEDCALIVEVLSGMPAVSFDGLSDWKPRIGFCRTPYWQQADAPTHAALEGLAARLSAAGAAVRDLALPKPFDMLAETQIAVSGYEFYRALAWERTHHPRMISAHLTGRLEAAGRVSYAKYEEGQALSVLCRIMLDEVFRDYDALLCPSAPGEAPAGLDATGDPIFGLTWSLMHAPCVTLPLFKGPNGLPLGAQIVGRRGTDALTLRCAEWVRRATG